VGGLQRGPGGARAPASGQRRIRRPVAHAHRPRRPSAPQDGLTARPCPRVRAVRQRACCVPLQEPLLWRRPPPLAPSPAAQTAAAAQRRARAVAAADHPCPRCAPRPRSHHDPSRPTPPLPKAWPTTPTASPRRDTLRGSRSSARCAAPAWAATPAPAPRAAARRSGASAWAATAAAGRPAAPASAATPAARCGAPAPAGTRRPPPRRASPRL
jgi:hypothetical protein